MSATTRSWIRWPGVAFLAGAALFLSAATSFAYQIVTDKLIYGTGEHVTVTGDGWQPYENVKLVLTQESDTALVNQRTVYTQADQSGAFVDSKLVMLDMDSNEIMFIGAFGDSGHETMAVFKDGVGPGSLVCDQLQPYDSTALYGLKQGTQVSCKIVDATDLVQDQRDGIEPVQVLVQTSDQGIIPANVTSVSGTTITFNFTAPASACGTALVSYGPIHTCNPACNNCTVLPAAANYANGKYINNMWYAAGGFQFLTGSGQVAYCQAPAELKVEKTPKNGMFAMGGQVSYTIVVSNPGSGIATGVTLSDVLPTNGGLDWATVTTTAGQCSIIKSGIVQTLKCGLGDIAPQGPVTVTVSSTATTPKEACTQQPNEHAIATSTNGLSAEDYGYVNCTPVTPITADCIQINAVKGVAIEPVTLTATGGAGGPYTFSATGLPAGLTMEPNGTISGTPTESGLFNYTVTILDKNQNSGTINCSVEVAPPPPSVCTIPGVIISNTSWNKFNVPSADTVVWVHAHIGTPSGVPTGVATQVLFRDVKLNFSNGNSYTLPDGVMNFVPGAGGITTTFQGGMWITTVDPTRLSNEIFFTGMAIPASEVSGGSKATLSFTVQSGVPNLSFPWQWSAAVYTFWPGYNEAQIQPFHSSYHAGTPLNRDVQRSLVAGPRGGGGSNFTGSWSATGKGTCPPNSNSPTDSILAPIELPPPR